MILSEIWLKRILKGEQLFSLTTIYILTLRPTALEKQTVIEREFVPLLVVSILSSRFYHSASHVLVLEACFSVMDSMSVYRIPHHSR